MSSDDVFRKSLAAAAEFAATGLHRGEGRDPAQGPMERREFAPSFVLGIDRAFSASEVQVLADERMEEISHWNRATSEVDIVVRQRGTKAVLFVGELKCWDISHQLFDLAKVTCLLAGGAPRGFLATIARRGSDFEHHGGGELFAPDDGERRSFDFADLATKYPTDFRDLFGRGLPEPTAVPVRIDTVAVGLPTPIREYPGNELRVCLVETPVCERLPLTSFLED